MSLLDAPELAPYQDEPKQMPSGAPGKHGVLDMSFARRGDRSVLAHLYREAPLLVQQALYWDEHLPGLPCVYIITTSGCVLQGDRLDVSVTVGTGAMAHVTTQSATKIHQMDANFAAQLQRLVLAENAYLELLPGPVIPHRHSRFITHTWATVAENATLLTAELLQPGRKHHGAGELFEFDLYSSTLTASRPDGAQLFTEKLIAEPWRHPVRQVGVMGKFDVFANATLITPRRHADAIFEQVVPGADTSTDCVAGASRLPHDAGLVYKVLGMETEPVKAKVRAFWNLVRRQVLGAPIPVARPWGSPLLSDATQRSSDMPNERRRESADLEDYQVLDSFDTLDGAPGDDPLDRGVVTPDRWSAAIRFGTTSAEQQTGESLDQALAEEEPDVALDNDDEQDHVSGPDENATDEDVARYVLDDGPDPRAGRLVDEDDEVYEEGDNYVVAHDDRAAHDAGIDGGGATAEEAAIHIVSPS
jgi:urease accessory protein